jgi:hypothetical protein
MANNISYPFLRLPVQVRAAEAVGDVEGFHTALAECRQMLVGPVNEISYRSRMLIFLFSYLTDGEQTVHCVAAQHHSYKCDLVSHMKASVDLEKHLIQVPPVTGSRRTAPQAVGIV